MAAGLRLGPQQTHNRSLADRRDLALARERGQATADQTRPGGDVLLRGHHRPALDTFID